MRAGTLLLTLVLVTVPLLALTPDAGAQPAVAVTVAAREGPDCPTAEQKFYCFAVTDGSLEGLPAGATVQLTLVNEGQVSHNLLVTTPDQADGNHQDTPGDAAIASTETIGGGGETNVTFTVPADAEGLYLWCDVQTHESLGMWTQVSTSGAAGNDTGDAGDGGDDTGEDGSMDGGSTDDGDQDDSGVPLPAWAPLAGLLAAAAVAARTRQGS